MMENANARILRASPPPWGPGTGGWVRTGTHRAETQGRSRAKLRWARWVGGHELSSLGKGYPGVGPGEELPIKLSLLNSELRAEETVARRRDYEQEQDQEQD